MAEAEKASEEGAEEYESGLDEGPLSVARRRGTASDDDDDDEEEDHEEGGGGSSRGSPPPSTVSGSESDGFSGQGAAELYDDEMYGTEEEEEEGVECVDVREESEAGVAGGGGETGVVNGEVSLAADEGKYEGDEAAAEGDQEEEAAMRRVEVKKAGDSEPYAVPTAGNFYEHDNRFQDQEDRNHGYQRQSFGGQKIWVPKEEAVWAHDLFNEINLHDSKHDNASIMQSVDNGYFHGSKSYYDTKSVENVKQTQFHSYHGNAKGYSDERNMYRERGSRTNQSRQMTFRISPARNNIKSYFRSQDAEVSCNAGAKKQSCQTSLQHEQNLPCNQLFGSNKSSAPPPFYSATRSSHQELPFIQREKEGRITFNKLFSSAVRKAHLQHKQTLPCKQILGSKISSLPPPFNSSTRSPHQELPFMQREKEGRIPFNKLFSSAVHKAHLQHEQTLPCKQFFVSNISSGPPPFYSSRSSRQRHYAQPCNAVYQQRSVQRPILPTPRASAKIFVQKVTSTKNIQSHPQTTMLSSYGDGEATAPPESNSSIEVSTVTGNDDTNGEERTYFLDGGSLVLGNSGARGSMLDDPGSSNTTKKLPVAMV